MADWFRSNRAWRKLPMVGDAVSGLSATSGLVEPRPVRRAVMGDGAAGRLPYQTRIFRERARPMPRRSRLPGLPPLSQFLAIDQQIHLARVGIDPDAVALAHQGKRTADEGFRRNITDAHAPRSAGKTPIRDERDLLAHALPIN